MVIDDNKFPLKDALKNIGYHIDYKKDITTLKDVAPYDMVLCDIKGVGKKFNSQYEGAYLIKLIRKELLNYIKI